MTDDGTSPLEAVSGADTERTTAAFEVLSNETRLAILLALWEAFDPAHSDRSVSFSDLRDRVGMRDSGQFNYHLDKLTGWFVERTEEGYRLRQAGQKFVRTVIAGAGIEAPTLDPTVIDVPCPLCGGETAVAYEDEWLYRSCTACGGGFEGGPEGAEGYLSGMSLEPAGFAGREPEELWVAAWTRANQALRSMVEGACNECSGRVEQALSVCQDHDQAGEDEVCGNCGRTQRIVCYLGCTVCKNYHVIGPRSLVAHHPAVVSFYHRHGVDIQYAVDDFESIRRRNDLIAAHEQELVSADPPRVLVTVRYQGEELRLTVDGNLDIVDITTDADD